MFSVGADAYTADSVSTVVGRVSFVGRATGRQILIFEEGQILIDVKRFQ